jgi:hypothetical protein
MLRFPPYIARQRARKQEGSIAYQGFPLGENTSVPPLLLKPQELEQCIDFKMNPGGRLETRPPVAKLITTDLKNVVDIRDCIIAGTTRTIITAGTAADGYKVYYKSGTAATLIGTIDGAAKIAPYNNVALICDGSYLKYLDGVTAVKMAYDDGDETNTAGGSMYNNYTGDQDGTTAISSAGTGCTFTTPDWGNTLTIPPTRVWVHCQETLAPASITAEIVDATTSTVMATVAYTGTVPSTAADFIEINFGTIANELEPDTEYYCLIKGSNVDISHTTVTSGGALITSGSTADTTKNPVMRVNPGLPPKADWAIVSNTRVFVYDPDNPGSLNFGNLTHLDWSTVDGGGYVTTIDNSRTSFKIGAAQDLYGELYVYGTQDQPFICKLTGSSPSAYSLPLLFQRIWACSDTIQNTGSDIWVASEDGVDALSGVQEYGDLRTFSASDPIKDQLASYWSSSAITGYYPADGQFWLYMPGSDYVNICHTKQAIRDQDGQVRYPWTRYDLPVTPTCFSPTVDGFLIGSSDGFVYKLDPDEYKDLTTTQIYPSFKTARIDMPARQFNLVMVQFAGHSRAGSRFDFDIYKDGNTLESVNTWSVTFPMSDSLTVDELTMDIDDMLFAISPNQTPLYFDINVNVVSAQFEVSNVFIAGYPVFFDGIFITYRALEQ